jgi:NAD-dependent deacetylase
MSRTVCPSNGRTGDVQTVRESRAANDLPSTCDRCGGPLKPDGVLFGEPLPERKLFEARSPAESSDVFLVAESPLTVESAASLPPTAGEPSSTLGIVNLESTLLDDFAVYTFRADMTTALPRVTDAMLGLGSVGPGSPSISRDWWIRDRSRSPSSKTDVGHGGNTQTRYCS